MLLTFQSLFYYQLPLWKWLSLFKNAIGLCYILCVILYTSNQTFFYLFIVFPLQHHICIQYNIPLHVSLCWSSGNMFRCMDIYGEIELPNSDTELSNPLEHVSLLTLAVKLGCILLPTLIWKFIAEKALILLFSSPSPFHSLAVCLHSFSFWYKIEIKFLKTFQAWKNILVLPDQQLPHQGNVTWSWSYTLRAAKRF